MHAQKFERLLPSSSHACYWSVPSSHRPWKNSLVWCGIHGCNLTLSSDLNLSSNACPEVWETFAKLFACYIDLSSQLTIDHERIRCAGVGPWTIISFYRHGNYNHDDAIDRTSCVKLQLSYKVIINPEHSHFCSLTMDVQGKDENSDSNKTLEGKVLLINATYRAWPKVSQTSGHAFLTGWCAISSFYEKGKVSALTALTECNFSSLYSVFGETNASESDLMKAEKAYISAWYGQTKGTSLAEARYLLYTLKRGKHMKVMSLPPTTPKPISSYLASHAIILDLILWAYHAIMIEAVDQQSPPHLHFAKFGWDINGGFLILANANQLTEPLELIQIMHATA